MTDDTDRLAMVAALVGTREDMGPFFADEEAARFWAPGMARVFRRVVGADSSDIMEEVRSLRARLDELFPKVEEIR